MALMQLVEGEAVPAAAPAGDKPARKKKKEAAPKKEKAPAKKAAAKAESRAEAPQEGRRLTISKT